MLLVDSGTSGDEFGFEIPTGSPAEIDVSADVFRSAAEAVRGQQAVLRAAAKVGDSSAWKGPAGSAYRSQAESLIQIFESNAVALSSAAGALDELSTALETAQTATQRAFNKCRDAFDDQQSNEIEAHDAGVAADNANQQAQNAKQPDLAAHYTSQADQSSAKQQSALRAASEAADRLASAQRDGERADAEYQHAAASAVAKLDGLEGELKPPPDEFKKVVSALASVVEWAGKGGDAVAGFVDTAKAFGANRYLRASDLLTEKALQLCEEIEAIDSGDASALADARWSSVSGSVGDAGDDTNDLAQLFKDSKFANSLGESGFAKFFTSSVPGTADLVSRFGLAAAITVSVLDIADGKNVGKVLEKQGTNLAVGSVGSALVTTAIGTLSEDGLGIVLITGAPEIVLVAAGGAVAVLATDWVIDHPKEALHIAEQAVTAPDRAEYAIVSGDVHALVDVGAGTVKAGEALANGHVGAAAGDLAHGVEHGGEAAWHGVEKGTKDLEFWHW